MIIGGMIQRLLLVLLGQSHDLLERVLIVIQAF